MHGTQPALVAQLVEQVTLNHRVQGSSPCGGISIKIPGNLATSVALFPGIFFVLKGDEWKHSGTEIIEFKTHSLCALCDSVF